MEAAAIGGKKVAEDIINRYISPKSSKSLIQLPSRPLKLLNIFRYADHLLFKIGFPDISIIIIILIGIIVLYQLLIRVKGNK